MEARPVDPYFSKIGSISSWKTETVQKLMNTNQLYQPQPHSTLSPIWLKKIGFTKKTTTAWGSKITTIWNPIILGWIRMGSPIESVLLYNRLQSVIGIRGVQKKDQKEKYTASGILNPKDSSVRSIPVKRGFYTTCKSKPLSKVWILKEVNSEKCNSE